jgi:hypothetical protein
LYPSETYSRAVAEEEPEPEPEPEWVDSWFIEPLLDVHVDMAWVSPAGPMVSWSGEAGMWNEFEVADDEAGEAVEMGEF